MAVPGSDVRSMMMWYEGMVNKVRENTKRVQMLMFAQSTDNKLGPILIF
jgi:hypothetical protein